MRGWWLGVALAACGDDAGPPMSNIDGSVSSTDSRVGDAPSATGITVTLTAAGANLVTWRDGDGAYNTLIGNGGMYSFTPMQPRFTLIVVCAPTTSGSTVTVFLATPSDAASYAAPCAMSTSPATYHDVSGTISGLVAGDSVTAYGVPSQTQTSSGASVTYTVSVAEGASRDLLYRRVSGSATTFRIDRAVSVLADLTHDVDMSSAFALEPHTVTATNTGSNETLVYLADFLTAGGSGISTGVGPMVPVANQVAGDLHRAFAGSVETQTLNGRFAGHWFAAPMDITLPLPPALGSTTITTVTRTPLRLSTTLAGTSVALGYVFSLGQPTSGATRRWKIYATTGWIGSASTLEMPDISGITSWDSAWNLSAGSNVRWNTTYIESNRSFSHALALIDNAPVQIPPSDGLTARAGQREQFHTP